MYKVLIVDDEQAIRELVAKYCSLEGFDYGEASDGLEAIEKVKKGGYDIVVMDVMMPELDGFSAKIHGLEIGADDYIGKPFSPKELMLRISAVMNRVANQKSNSDVYENEKLKVDFTARIVSVEGVPQDLSPKEYELLFFMVKNRGIALSREKLLNEVWGYDFYGDDRTLDTHIKLLRKSLGVASEYIVTLRGMGYRFDG